MPRSLRVQVTFQRTNYTHAHTSSARTIRLCEEVSAVLILDYPDNTRHSGYTVYATSYPQLTWFQVGKTGIRSLAGSSTQRNILYNLSRRSSAAVATACVWAIMDTVRFTARLAVHHTPGWTDNNNG